jgi:4-amino-4-deoxy-L-arabinose transferase-like glycosyltransferase
MDNPLTTFERKLPLVFWSMVIIHALTWTLAPLFIRHAVSNDIIEVITWGHQLQWGYDKNPWLPALLAHLGVMVGGTSAIGIYFIQQLFVVLAFWSIWRLTQLLTNNAYALIASMMLEGCVCYTLNVQLYNDNYILLGLWPLSALLFYHVIQTNRWRFWVALSVTLGLATMAKYDTIIMVGLYSLFLLLNKKYWQYLLTIKPWAALSIYCTILLPNLIWLSHYNFISLHYAFVERAKYQHLSEWEHIRHNFDFVQSTVINFLPAFLVMLTGLSFRSIRQHAFPVARGFIFFIAFAPFLTLLVIALLMGLDLANEWGMVLIGFWGSYFLQTFRPEVTIGSLKRFISIIYVLLIFWPLGYIAISLKQDTGNYPGPEIAQRVTQQWHQNFNTPLSYVAGSRYVAGYVGFYSKDKPAVLMEWNNKVSSWINLDDLKCRGAIFIQDSGHTVMDKNYRGSQFPSQVLQAYPTLIILPLQNISWYRNRTHQADLQLLVGLLPPSPNCVK